MDPAEVRTRDAAVPDEHREGTAQLLRGQVEGPVRLRDENDARAQPAKLSGDGAGTDPPENVLDQTQPVQRGEEGAQLHETVPVRGEDALGSLSQSAADEHRRILSKNPDVHVAGAESDLLASASPQNDERTLPARLPADDDGAENARPAGVVQRGHGEETQVPARSRNPAGIRTDTGALPQKTPDLSAAMEESLRVVDRKEKRHVRKAEEIVRRSEEERVRTDVETEIEEVLKSRPTTTF